MIGEESENPSVTLNYNKSKKVFDSTLVLNYLIFQKPATMLFLAMY